MQNKNILISGAGIAGPTLAYWLNEFGFNPVIVEQAPALREGGYAIDFVGAGFDVAEKMKLLPELRQNDLEIQELVFVDKDSVRKGAVNSFRMRSLLDNRYLNIFRSDLSKAIYNKLDKSIEIIFGDSITKIDQDDKRINVTFNSGKFRKFDLVIGADGLHSNVRRLLYGSGSNFGKYLGFYVAAIKVENYLPDQSLLRKNNSFYSYTVPGKQVDVYSLNENELTALFIFASDRELIYTHSNIADQKAVLRDEYKDVEWECPHLLERLSLASDFYFDSVCQIRMESWSQGRVTLIGDAGYAPSLLAGQGSSLAMVAAYILAGELKAAGGNYKVAFQQYEKIFKPFIDYKQNVARSFAHSLVPQNNLSIWSRQSLANLMKMPFFSKWFIKKYMTDNITLKEY